MKIIKNNNFLLFEISFFFLNFILKYFHVTSAEISLDEPTTLYYSQLSLKDLFEFLKSDNNPPLFYLLMHGWVHLFGIGALAGRFLPLLFSSLTVVFIFKICNRCFNLRTAIIACIIYTASNKHIFYAHDARVYSLFALLATMSFYYFLRGIESSTKRLWILFSISNILLCYSHFLGFIIVFFEGICLLTIPNLRNKFKAYFISCLALLASYLIYVPVLWIRFTSSIHGTWIEKPARDDLYAMIKRFSNAPVFAALFLFIILIGIIITYQKKQSNLSKQNTSIVLFMFLCPFLGIYFLSFYVPMFIDRYIIFSSIFFYLLAGISFDKLLPSNAQGWILAIAIPASMFITTDLNSNKESKMKELVSHMKKINNGNAITIITPDWDFLSYVYYANPSWFKIEHGLTDTLNKNNIYPVNKLEYIPLDVLQSFDKIIFIDFHHDIINNTKLSYNGSQLQYRLNNEYKKFENTSVYYYEK